MEKARIKALQKQIKEWKRYSEPPAKISRMVADQVVGWLNEYRAKNTDYLTNQLNYLQAYRDVLAARTSFIDNNVVSKSSLKYAALPTLRLKVEVPKSYSEALVLAKELRARGADLEADRASMKAEILSQDYLYNRDFQGILGDALARSATLLAPSMIPTTPIEEVTAANIRQKQIRFIPISDFIKEIAGGDRDLYEGISEMVERDAGRSHLPQKLKNEYSELGKLRVHQEPTFEEVSAAWDPDYKEEFLANLPENIREQLLTPKSPATDMSRLPAQKTDPAHEAAIEDIARGIIADERAALTKEISSLKGGEASS